MSHACLAVGVFLRVCIFVRFTVSVFFLLCAYVCMTEREREGERY